MKNSAFAVLIAVLITGCPAPSSAPPQNVTTNTNTTVARTFLMKSDALDLSTVIGLIQNNQVGSAEQLVQMINDPSSAINNVDTDNDDKIDYIGVKESNDNGQRQLDLVALPSSKGGNDPVTVAQISFTRDTVTNQVVVRGAYPDYVDGYDTHFYVYNHGPTAGDLMLWMWMSNAARPFYVYRPYGSIGYTPRVVYQPSYVESTRTTYRNVTRVAPIRTDTRPQNYSIKSAEPVRSRYASPPAPTGNGFSDRAGQMRAFKERDSSIPQPKATGFGVKAQDTTVTKPSAPPKSGWGSSSGSSGSSNWGSSSRSSSGSSSGWGSSSRSSSSGSTSRSSSTSSKPKSSGWGSSSRSSGSSSWGSKRK